MSLTPLSCDGLNDYVLEFERHRRHYARPVGISWRVDETYIRVGGRWTYLYRAADKQGLAVDFWLSEQRER
jgi:putative transposase